MYLYEMDGFGGEHEVMTRLYFLFFFLSLVEEMGIYVAVKTRFRLAICDTR